MIFVLFALAAIVWSAALFGWIFARRFFVKILVALSLITLSVASVSIVGDVREISAWARARPSDLQIAVFDDGHWRRVAYRRGSQQFITANEIHVPEHTRLLVWWNGKPILFRADDPRFIIDPQFDRWFADQLRPANSAGSEAFESAGCPYCHVIRGVAQEARYVAPDLTHFASRKTIAATHLRNDRGDLEGWIVNSRALKRNSLMPENNIDGRVLHDIASYLESLR